MKNDDFITEGKGLFNQIKDSSRSFHAHTGAAGMKQFRRAVERVHIDPEVKELLQIGKIDLHEWTTINKMLDSTDDRDFELAKAIIKAKT